MKKVYPTCALWERWMWGPGIAGCWIRWIRKKYLPCNWNTYLLVRNEDRAVRKGVKE